MPMYLLNERATSEQVRAMMEPFAKLRMIKIVVDIGRNILAGGGAMHFDCEQLLINNGSKQVDLWGANWYPDEQTIEFESLINIRPRQNNRSIILEDPVLQRAVERVARQYLEGVFP